MPPMRMQRRTTRGEGGQHGAGHLVLLSPCHALIDGTEKVAASCHLEHGANLPPFGTLLEELQPFI